jgi:hypothetical protein
MPQGCDKKTIANDIWQLVNEQLGHKSFYMVQHDCGGSTADALAAAHPEAVRGLVISHVVIRAVAATSRKAVGAGTSSCQPFARLPR